jgi:pimeloyl-[acyl-carrier protein] methyl ester esterase
MDFIFGGSMELVLLPGMDGTGILFQPLLDVLPEHLNTHVITYPKDYLTTWEELINLIITQLPENDFLLIGESYSGYLAYRIALLKPSGLQKVMFVATFVSCPRPILASMTSWGLAIMKQSSPPKMISEYFFTGYNSDPNLLELFRKTVNTVRSEVLRHRLEQISKRSEPSEMIDIPCYYLRAEQDRLIPLRSISSIEKVCPNLTVFTVAGPHLILQVKPKECWMHIQNIIS